MFRHDYVPDNIKPVAVPSLFERTLEDTHSMDRIEEGLPPIATEGDEMKTFGLLESLESPRHEWRLLLGSILRL